MVFFFWTAKIQQSSAHVHFPSTKTAISVDGAFLAVGLMPENEPFAALENLNSWGYFDTDESCCTKTPGIFVAGDCRSKRIRQVVTASADGAIAAMAACHYLDR